MNTLRRGVAMLVAAAALAADAAGLSAAVDLQKEAKAIPEGVVLVLFSLPGCRYCDEVRSQHLVPLLQEQDRRGRVAVLEVDMASDAALRDFSGAPVTHRVFARAEGARVAPTVVAFRDGERVGEPIVGAKIPEFYGYYLANLLDRAFAP